MMRAMLCAAILVALALAAWLIYDDRRLRRENLHLQFADGLTGAWNLTRFRQEAKRMMEHGVEGYALVYLDVDKFKYINDTLGYDAGDMILMCLSNCIRDHMKPDEISARVAADNFVILARFRDQEELKRRFKGFMEDLNKSLAEWSHYVVLTSGVYFLKQEDRDPNFVIERANFARSRVRCTYTSSYMIYTEDIATEMAERKKLEEDMVNAFRRKEFMAFYQPKVDIFTGQIVGAEALVRWDHPVHSILPPRDFLCRFEENGLIVDVDFYIFEEVCRWLQQRLEGGMAVVPISCNFSRLHLRDAGFAENVEKVARRYHIPHRYLEVEITENFAIENMDLAVSQLQQLNRMGFRIAIDDFGSAYSSMELLNRLPMDVVKLDKSFLDKSNDCDEGRIVLEGVVSIFNRLRLEVVCEGVETEEHERLLREVGCRIGQGYRYAKPMPIGQFEEMLDRRESRSER